MSQFICITCGTQFAETAQPPAHCPICEDPRQYVGYAGQQWTTLDALRQTHCNRLTEFESGLQCIVSEPKIGIGQRAWLMQTVEGNLLWDCISLIDDATIEAVRALGGIRAIAISHPHFYSCQREWSRAFGDVPVYLNAADRAHVMTPNPAIHFWDAPTLPLFGGLTLIHCGGHFAGSSALHWPGGAAGRGVLFAGDTLQVVQDRRFVSFMRSYPNLIPLPAAAVRAIAAAVAPFAYDRLYGAFSDSIISVDAHAAVQRSAERYVQALM